MIQHLSFFLSLLCCAALLATPLKAEETQVLYSKQKHGEVQLPKEDVQWGPLRENGLLLIRLRHEFAEAMQKEVMEKLLSVGGLFLYYRPQWSMLFLGDDAVLEAAKEMKSVLSAEVYDAADKMSSDWKPVLKALETHSLGRLASEPLHQLTNTEEEISEGHHFFGNIAVDRRGVVDRLVIEVGFPMFHMTDTPSLPFDEEAYAPAQAAARDWLLPLKREFGDDVDVLAYHGFLDVFVPESAVLAVLEFLSRQTCVHWLQPKTKVQLHNWRASGIIQSSLAPEDETGLIDARIHPIWAAGIQGEGQVVGCGDSGMDIDSCYFHDPDISFQGNIKLNTILSAVHSFFESEEHRKIRFYGSSSDFNDGDGHGTHVAGTLVGNPTDTEDELAVANKGMAPKAKIAFMDLGSQADNSTDSIFTPRELSTFYYPLTYQRGARVHSDSWGSDSPAYDLLAQEVDKFVWEHQDFLPVFAAGNYGQLSLRYLTTVTSPALAKNCLSVGATLTANQAIRFRTDTISAYLIEVRVTDSEGGAEVRRYKILAAEFGASWNDLLESTSKDKIELILGTPDTGCTTLNSDVRDQIVLLKRTGCKFVQKLKNAQAKGATAVIVMNHLNKGYFTMEKDKTDDTPDSELTIPIGSVPLSVGRELRELLESNRRVTIQVMERTEPANSYDNVADFSSSGPTIDFRIKPDIVAPGHTKSVASDGQTTNKPPQCSLNTRSGTSMATPVVAGAALLVRQYFVDGFYPSGEKNAKDAHIPSGALMKATLLGGAFAMDGYTETGLPLAPPPSARQGFGRVYLETSIPVAGSQKWKEGWRIQVVDGANLTTGQSHEYCVRALGGPIRVTLVWTDPPASPSSPTVLVHDLDLSVRSAGLKGRELLGNGVEDRLNNVERVQMDDMPKGNLAIVVKANRTVAAYGTQPYALVVQGRFNGILQSIHNPYQSEATSTSDLCIITLAVLESGPEGPINYNDPEFRFTTQSGVRPVNGFECKLTDTNGDKDGFPSLHDWTECSSPQKYDNLGNAEYIFTVRPKNEDVEVQRKFVVDTQAPLAEIIGQPIPSESARESVEFQFRATDLTPVVFHCKLSLEGTRRGVKIARLSSTQSNVKLDSWFKCSSPEAFRGLTHGNWTFTVRGQDKAGNTQMEPTVWSWRIMFSSDLYYVRTKTAPLAISASPTVSFSLQVVTGDASGKPVVLRREPVECRLFPANNPSVAAFPYRECPLSLKYPNISDGEYGFQARSVDPRGHPEESVSLVEFSVDSTEPVISFSQRPSTYHGARDLVLKFQADEVLAGYNCSMRRRGAPKRFIQCPGSEPGTVDYRLEDGWYTFQVKAQDLAGNYGFSEDVTFMIDSVPPRILFKAPAQFNTNQTSVSFEFRIEDKGSGVETQNSTCSLLEESSGVRSEQQPGSCTSPVSLNLEEGRYLFTLRAVDKAGLMNERDLPIIVDFTPPSIAWISRPSINAMMPPFVVFQFQGSDEPKNIASLVTSFECRLTLRGRRKTQPTPSQRFNLTENGKRRMLLHALPRGVTTRHLTQTNASAVGSESVIRIRDGADVILGEWVACDNPVVLTGMPSGKYAFHVRAIDHAGNTGSPTNVSVFRVDDSLPIPGDASESDSSGDVAVSQSVALAIAAASVVFVLAMCVVVGCWRRRSRRRRAEKMEERQRGHVTRGDVIQETYRNETGSSSSTDAMLAAAMKASVRQQQLEEEHRRLEDEAAAEEQRIQAAMQHSLEQYEYQKAVERSLHES